MVESKVLNHGDRASYALAGIICCCNAPLDIVSSAGIVHCAQPAIPAS
jgi:hypothetical protein